jgi:hypothetical protein
MGRKNGAGDHRVKRMIDVYGDTSYSMEERRSSEPNMCQGQKELKTGGNYVNPNH